MTKSNTKNQSRNLFLIRGRVALAEALKRPKKRGSNVV